MYDPATAIALEQDKGLTADAMARDRKAAARGPAPGAPSSSRRRTPTDDEPSSPLPAVPKGFDPYLMNGTGPNDSRLENIGKNTPSVGPIQCVVQ